MQIHMVRTQKKSYHDEHNEYPSDYTTLTLSPLDKEVGCDVEIYSDGKIFLTKCSVNSEEVLDENQDDGYYHYGKQRPIAAQYLVHKANDIEIDTYTNGNTHEMYTFDHDATEQTPALTDYRYIGNDPYNYVSFNDELWRIIGVFDTDDGTGNYEKRVKLIRTEFFDDKKWTIYNNNEWLGSTMQKYLNETYILNFASIEMISDIKWYLGGRNNSINGDEFYKSERSLTVKSEDRSKNWIGKVALMYPSDYIYTYSLGIDDICYNTPNICKIDSNGVPSNSWMYSLKHSQWTLTPQSSTLSNIFVIRISGDFYIDNGYKVYNSRPTLYLKSNVKIKSGDGSIDNPYEFELQKLSNKCYSVFILGKWFKLFLIQCIIELQVMCETFPTVKVGVCDIAYN